MPLDKDEVRALGKQYYEPIRAEMEAKHWGRMVVIDVTTGNIEIDADDYTATQRLFERNPNAVTWGELAGYRTPYSMSGGLVEIVRDTPVAATSPPADDAIISKTHDPAARCNMELTADDIYVLGKQYYEEIRAEMEANYWGHMVVIDVTTGNIEIDADDYTATQRLFERNPNAMTWGELVGYVAPYSMGGGGLVEIVRDAPTVESIPPADSAIISKTPTPEVRCNMPMDKDEVRTIGKQYYEEIRAEMEANHWGRMVVIDVTTGNIEIDADDYTATQRLFERNPNAMTWGEKAGYRAAYRMTRHPYAYGSKENPARD